MPKTVLNDEVSIGSGAIIMPGITIEKAIIGAGAVVNKDVKENKVAGVPAKNLICNAISVIIPIYNEEDYLKKISIFT